MKWFYETLHAEVQEGLRIDNLLYDGRTKFQSVKIFDNNLMGRVLVLDDVIQTTEKDEFIYHEMLAHIPILALSAVDNVLIIGGGDGGCLEEVLKHDVTKATMVDLDGDVVTLCREYFANICGAAFDDERTELIIGDGAAFVAETKDRFDVIIIDSTDPIGPGEILFQEAFYRNCRECLTEQGVLITQNGVPTFQLDEYRSSKRAFENLFTYSGFYFAAVPSYSGGDLAFGWASKGTDMAKSSLTLLRQRYEASGIQTEYYNPDIHKGAFAVPNYLKRL